MVPSTTTPNFSRPLPSPFSARVLGSPARQGGGHQGQGWHKTKLSSGQVGRTGEPDETLYLSVDLGGADKPIPNFRPTLWRQLDRKREILNLDLFWPMKLEDALASDDEDDDGNNPDKDPKGVFPYQDLVPLQSFHNLRHLQLNGMMRSYQPLIWATCWVNKNLVKVHLEMALEPVICEDVTHKFRKIDEKWAYNRFLNESNQPLTLYLGNHGDGTLHKEFGEGEYLDQHAIKTAQLADIPSLPRENTRYLPITHLTLMNFVVDSGPFFRWFDPAKLKEISFRGDCIDAGFYLPQDMQGSVQVHSPKPVVFARVVKPGEVKLVDIKPPKANKTLAQPEPLKAGGSSGTGSGAGAGAGVAGGNGTALKKKLSQIMPKWGIKASKDKEGKERDEAGGHNDTARLERQVADLDLDK